MLKGLYVTNRMYRYDALIKAIDFFTQRFTLEQLSKYSFEFANEILTLNSSALFILQDGEFRLKNKRLYNLKEYRIENKEKIQKIASLHGSIILDNFGNFFEDEDIENLKMDLVIPLIIDGLLFGFIISDGKALGEFNDEDYTMAMALMRLFNNSLENSRNFRDLKIRNRELDQKIFNLFAVNQSAKSLLSELSLDNLITMAVDVFSELTTSKITSFGIVDEISQKLQILGYRNVDTFTTALTEFEINPNVIPSRDKIVLNLDKDIDRVKELFVNWKEFYSLNAQYIILLVRDRLLGLVTISEPLADKDYDATMFELIESLASCTFIALENALLFEETSRQKEIIEAKFQTLSNFNTLVNNINQCISIEELCDITLQTLNISFDIERAFIAFREGDCYRIKYSIDEIGLNQTLFINDKWQTTFDGDTIYNFLAQDNISYLGEEICKLFDDSTGMVISPIILDRLEIGERKKPFAYIVVLKTPDNLQEEEILLIDTIAKNITPVIYHMDLLDKYQKSYVPNSRQLFYDAIDKKLKARDKYNLDFNIYYKILNGGPFHHRNLTKYQAYEHYLIDNYLFIISYEDLSLEDFKTMASIDKLEDIKKYNFTDY